MNMPTMATDFSGVGTSRRSYTADRMRGIHSSSIAGVVRSEGTTEQVMAIGHGTPPSGWLNMYVRTD